MSSSCTDKSCLETGTYSSQDAHLVYSVCVQLPVDKRASVAPVDPFH